MLSISDLKFGFNDAENYKLRENKNLFNKFFIRTEDIDKLVQYQTYFLIGDKGTGKTALAVYLTNNTYSTTSSKLKYVRETDYLKFMSLKKEKNLGLSDYTNIWKVILYLLISQKIYDQYADENFLNKHLKFKSLKQAIDDYYKSAFSPEIIYALNFVEESSIVAQLISKYLNINKQEKSVESFTESRYQINLLYIQNKFESALASVRLPEHQILFIDGIDIRPFNVPYKDYLECIKGLAAAVWSINSDFFANIKGDRGKIKVVTLLRPDIFSSLGLQNQNNKIRDNSVLLDWKTSYPNYRSSSIFKLIDNILSSQQIDKKQQGECWDYYFPYVVNAAGKTEDSFISFLRYSMSKPRDIISMLTTLQEIYMQKGDFYKLYFAYSDFENPGFKSIYSDYLLGEIKDFLSFYHDEKDYEMFIKFFEYLDGKFNFNYEEFIDAYDKFMIYVDKSEYKIPIFFDTEDSFLQFLYNLNAICYIDEAENETFFKWCYRERSYSNPNPKVKSNAKYSIHYGLFKGLNTGKRLLRKNR